MLTTFMNVYRHVQRIGMASDHNAYCLPSLIVHTLVGIQQCVIKAEAIALFYKYCIICTG